MSSEHLGIDPEVRVILESLVRDPSSSLLLKHASCRAEAVGIRHAAISVGEPFLSSAEKHLLLRRREELGHLLYAACRQELERPIGETRFYPQPSESDPKHLESRILRFGRTADVERDANYDLVDRWRSHAARTVAPVELAAASLLVLPTDRTRILLALTQRLDGQLDRALETTGGLLSRPLSAWNESVAHATRGSILCEQHRFGEAADEYRVASLALGGDPSAIPSWFVQAVYTANRDMALYASRLLEDRRAERANLVDESVELFRACVASEAWSPAESSESLLSGILDELPPAARKIADVIL